MTWNRGSRLHSTSTSAFVRISETLTWASFLHRQEEIDNRRNSKPQDEEIQRQTSAYVPRQNLSFELASAGMLCALPPVTNSSRSALIPPLSASLLRFISPQLLAVQLPSFPLPFSIFPPAWRHRCSWVQCPPPTLLPFARGVEKSLPCSMFCLANQQRSYAMTFTLSQHWNCCYCNSRTKSRKYQHPNGFGNRYYEAQGSQLLPVSVLCRCNNAFPSLTASIGTQHVSCMWA